MKTKAKYRFIEFVRPGSFWPLPYTLEQAFGVFEWMLQTSTGRRDDSNYGRENALPLLSANPGCVNYSEVDPIRSVADLRNRFHYALLSDIAGPRLTKWRTDNCIFVGGEKTIAFPHHAYGKTPTCEHDARVWMDALLGARGRLGVSLNSCWSRAREIYRVELHWRGCYTFVLVYGLQGSEWRHPLSRQMPREPFYASFHRARRALAKLVDGELTEAKA